MEPSAADFHDALLRVIGSSTFRSSPRLSELLVHLVEQTLAGHADRLKGYAIALDVFGRDEGFDASSDSIVRVQMARLRKALVEYYGGEGARDPARIVLSRGSYVPSLELAAALQQPASDGDDAAAAEPEVAAGAQLPLEAAERTGSAALEAGDVEDASPEPSPSAGATEALLPSTASPGKRRAWILLAVLALVSALVIIYWPGELRDTVVSRAGEMPRGPTVYVAPYSLTGGTAQAVHVRDGFQYDLVNYLSQLPNLAVIGLDPRGLSPTMERRARTAPRGSTFVLQGAILISGDKFRVNSSLV